MYQVVGLGHEVVAVYMCTGQSIGMIAMVTVAVTTTWTVAMAGRDLMIAGECVGEKCVGEECVGEEGEECDGEE